MSDQKTEPKTIEDIIADIEIRSSGGGYIFRGETKSRYKDHKGKYRTEVSSRLWRDYEFREEEGPGFDIEQVQKEMLDGAKRHIGRPQRRFGMYGMENPDDFEILTQIQHYGGKTNLIDFTTDYRSALFFACDRDYSEEGRIILQKRDAIINMIATPQNPQRRVIAQKSVFVRPPKGYIEPKVEDIVTIPAVLKVPILTYLEKYHGITKETMYNDLHGFIYYQDHHGDYYTKFYRGFACYARGNYDGAIEYYNGAIKLSPRDAAAYNNRGLAYNYKGEYDKAIIDLNISIEIDPNNANTYTNRGLAYTNQKEYDKAIIDLNIAIGIDPNNANTYTNRGIAHFNKEEYSKSLEDLTKSIELQPVNALAYYYRGRVFIALNIFDAAIVNLSKAIEIFPNYTDAYKNRSLAYGRIGEHEKARQDREKAEELERASRGES